MSSAQQLAEELPLDPRRARTLRLVQSQAIGRPLPPLDMQVGPSPLIDAIRQYLETLP